MKKAIDKKSNFVIIKIQKEREKIKMFVNDFGKEFKTLEEARADILNELRKDDGYIPLISEDINIYLVEVLHWIHENGLWKRFRKDFEKPISDAEKNYVDIEMTYFKEEEE